MTFETTRLLLRPWKVEDARDLYKYASDPDVGLPAGWLPHKSVEESRHVILSVFSAPEIYAICLKTENRPIGAIELKLKGHTNMTDREDECEMGFWVGKPFWGRGIMPEAAKEMIREGRLNFTQIAARLGFQSVHYFSRRFKLLTGMSPSEYSDSVKMLSDASQTLADDSANNM